MLLNSTQGKNSLDYSQTKYINIKKYQKINSGTSISNGGPGGARPTFDRSETSLLKTSFHWKVYLQYTTGIFHLNTLRVPRVRACRTKP